MKEAEMEARLDEIERTYATPEAMPPEVEMEYDRLSRAVYAIRQAERRRENRARMAEEEAHARGVEGAVKQALRTLGGA